MKKIIVLLCLLTLTACMNQEQGTSDESMDQADEMIEQETDEANVGTDLKEETDTSNEAKNSEEVDTETDADTEEQAATTEDEEVVQEEPEPSIYDLEFNPGEYQLVEAFPNLLFNKPLHMDYMSIHDDLYVVEKRGIIWTIPNDENVSEPSAFLDIRDRVSDVNNEDGLLGLAFHPDPANHPYYYINYMDREGTVISRFSFQGGDFMVGDPDSELILLRYNQPYANHNGGHMSFGPDGYLYIASGDGGSAGDPDNHAQNLTDLLGKILRIDVNESSIESPYAIPADNPFYGNEDGFAPEIYAYGLRNPWKFSFDLQRDILLAADVGQDKMEEINIIRNGGNYGWSRFEGTSFYKDIVLQGDGDLVDPVFEYEHPIGKSITGGYTYYGAENPGLYGAYIYGDFISGKVWALWINEDETAENVEILSTGSRIASFGLDSKGEIFIVDYRGKIYLIEEQE